MSSYTHKSGPCVDVAIIGNGPSAICLSYLLSGYRPYYNGEPHPNPILAEKLNKLGRSESLLNQELDQLCEGLEGRSSNPVAVLFDSLSRPDADLGGDKPSVLEWRHEPEHAINHVSMGRLKPGGSWQKMDGSMQTLSLSSWMELPDFPFKQWMANNRMADSVSSCSDRATITDVCNYYMSFVEEKQLRKNFLDYHVITSVQKVYKSKAAVVDSESGEIEPCCPSMKNHSFHYEVRGYRVINEADDDMGVNREEFCISALQVVLATGTFDIPNKLNVTGENLPFVSHSLHEFESVINNEPLSSSSDPVLIVGAGLSAADAVLMAVNYQVPVIHAFRRKANDSNLVLKKLPKNMYPEYHAVHSLMKGTSQSPLYKPVPQKHVIEIKEDKKVMLASHKGSGEDIETVDISHAALLIGARPDLNFLPHDGRDLGFMRNYPIESKHNPIDVDMYSYQSVKEPGLFAMGPLVGDNFVRFGLGGALGITHYLLAKHKN